MSELLERSPIERTERQFHRMLRNVAKMRRAEPRRKPVLMSADDLTLGDICARGEPQIEGRRCDIYEDGLRFWAEQVAPTISGDQWDAMVERAINAFPDWPGDVTRFAENLFEMLRLEDGVLVVP